MTFLPFLSPKLNNYFMSTHTHFKAVILQWWAVITDGMIDIKRVKKTTVLKQTEPFTSLFTS